MDELLEGSLRLLGISSTANDVLLQSTVTVRRRRGVKQRTKLRVAFTCHQGRRQRRLFRRPWKNSRDFRIHLVNDQQLESLLSFISGSRGKPKECRWLIASKLMQPNRVLQSLSHKPCSNVSVESFQNHMEILELCIQGLEAGIQALKCN
ncbi:hypothetical protein CR513_22165, partial [Mucuna pruriens]